MLKKILRIIEKIKCRLSCCYESQCSLNDENKIINKYIEDDKAEELADDRASF